jgi:hypothetical protein
MLNCYATGHQISNVIMAAFAEGFEGRLCPPSRLMDGPAAMYGILRGTGELIHQCRWVQREFYYVDHGYFKRGHFDGHYRVTRNGMQAFDPCIVGDDRFRALDVGIRPWRRDGGHVLVLPLTDAVADFHGIDSVAWESAVVNEIGSHTNRRIKIRPKPAQGQKTVPLKEDLEDCWCVVTHSSNTAVVALMEGIPVITLGESAASPLSWRFENLESPEWPEREPLFHWLAYNQFTLDELRNGDARKITDHHS